MVQNSIWVTWENQRRNREVSAALNIPLYEFAEIDEIKRYPIKYILGIAKTLSLLAVTRPRVVCCQNPSIILSLFLIILKSLFGIRIVTDSHNAGLFPLDGRSKALNFISRFIQRYADLTIVSNIYLRSQVEMNGGRAFVLPDKIPELKSSRLIDLKGKYNILFICTYAEDEPYLIVFEAAKIISREIFIYATGDFRKKGLDTDDLPENLILTGYISESDYDSMLYSVDAVIDLTTRENCLVCGAYESTAAGKPLVLSKTRALMEYFNEGAVYVNHTTDSIANGIIEAIRRKNELSKQIRHLKILRFNEWQAKKSQLDEILNTFTLNAR